MKVKSRYTTIGLIACLMAGPVWAVNKPAGAEAGKQLYQKGLRANEVDLTAYVGRASIAMPADSLPCVGCHGRDGRGRPEGGVKPSDITWPQLTKSYGGTSNSGRKFGSYTEDTFLRAVTEGVDAAGNKLDSSMPRFNISRHDARDLISYLKKIENEYDPGVTDSGITLATLQPEQGWQKQLGNTITTTLQAYFSDINQQGGVYGRKLKLKQVSYKDSQDFNKQVARTIASDEVFALLGSFSGNIDQSLTDQVEEAQMVSIAPFTNHPTAKGNEHRYTFYMYGGLESQVQALLKRTTKDNGKNTRVLVLYKDNGPYTDMAKHAREVLQKSGVTDIKTLPYKLDTDVWTNGLTESKKITKLLFLGSSADLLSIYPKWQSQLKLAAIYLPGILVSRRILELPDSIADKIELSYHSTPESNGQLQDFYQFMQRHHFDSRGLSMRLFAYSAARIAIEGLKRAGKRVSREKVVTALENLYDFDAGLNRLIRYGSSRRIGLHGAYIVKLDKQHNGLKATGDWVALD